MGILFSGSICAVSCIGAEKKRSKKMLKKMGWKAA